MTKRVSGILFCLILILAAIGCGGSSGGSAKTGTTVPAGVEEILKQAMAETDSKNMDSGLPESSIADTPSGTDAAESQAALIPAESSDPAVSSVPDTPAESIDVDLTVLSSTMVYSEVYSMMTTPEKYIGKTIKMGGLFTYYHDEATDNYYFACIVHDATACCAQGIEFVLTDDYKYPDDYPEVSDEICVVGVFDTYKEGEYLYCTLRNAKLL